MGRLLALSVALALALSSIGSALAAASAFPLSGDTDRARAVATDGAGNVYVGGHAVDGAALVQMYDPTGEEVWTGRFGTGAQDWVNALHVQDDPKTGSVGMWVAGTTTGAWPDNKNLGGRDAFLRKMELLLVKDLDNKVVKVEMKHLWTQQFGTAADDEALAAKVDPAAGRVWAAGYMGVGPDAKVAPHGFVKVYADASAPEGVKELGKDVFQAKEAAASRLFALGVRSFTGADLASHTHVYVAGAVEPLNTKNPKGLVRVYDGDALAKNEAKVLSEEQFLPATETVKPGVKAEVFALGLDAVNDSGWYVAGYSVPEGAGAEPMAFARKYSFDLPAAGGAPNHLWTDLFQVKDSLKARALGLVLDGAGNVYAAGEATPSAGAQPEGFVRGWPATTGKEPTSAPVRFAEERFPVAAGRGAAAMGMAARSVGTLPHRLVLVGATGDDVNGWDPWARAYDSDPEAALPAGKLLKLWTRQFDSPNPHTTEVLADPMAVGAAGKVFATVASNPTAIRSAVYKIDGGGYVPMKAVEGAFGVDSSVKVVGEIAAFKEPGVHKVCVHGARSTVEDTLSINTAEKNVYTVTGRDECGLVPVYDPTGGFVTGGGWIDSPAGAYMAAGDAGLKLTGRANFGFVSKYLQGAKTPTGETEFVFKVANLNFHSASYEWLVVTGKSKAQYKGAGTVNGEEGYGFMLTAVDGALKEKGGPDMLRMKIWLKSEDNVVYDNGLGKEGPEENPTALGGGSIVIHEG